jgi:hypothetical protein
MEGIVFGESPRWHDGRLWFSDWGAHQVIALDMSGGHEVMAAVDSFPMCIDFLPDGRLLVVDSAQRRLLLREPDGLLVPQADLSVVSDKRRLRLRAQPRARPALVRGRPGLGRTRAAGTYRTGRGVPGARTRCRKAVTPADCSPRSALAEQHRDREDSQQGGARANQRWWPCPECSQNPVNPGIRLHDQISGDVCQTYSPREIPANQDLARLAGVRPPMGLGTKHRSGASSCPAG